MNESLWLESSKTNRFKALNEDIITDILIVGGGITGITTAYLLAKEGLKVTLVDADTIGFGATGRNTGKITEQHNIIYSKIKKGHNLETAKRYYELNKNASKLIESLISNLSIDCNYEKLPSYLFTMDEKNISTLKNEFNVCKKIGIDCEYTNSLNSPLDDIKAAIKFNDTAQFNPKKYIDGLVEELLRLDCTIYENTPIKTLGKINPIEVITLNNHIIRPKKLIICSHYPFFDGLSFFFARLKPSRSYIVAGEYNGIFPNGTFINVEDPTISLRLYTDDNKRLLLIAGGDHKTGQNDNCNYYNTLREFGKNNFGITNYLYEWSAQDYYSTDNMPYVGYINTSINNIYVATGYAKWGITNGTAASIILKDLIVKKASNDNCIFYPSRNKSYFTTQSLKENIDVAYHYILGKIDVGSKEMPKKGEGKIVTLQHSNYGAYLDENEKLHVVDTTCTHLGCELQWNPTEKSWDCPCHGSRFSYDGSILNGPATIPLNHYGEEKNSISPNILSEDMR